MTIICFARPSLMYLATASSVLLSKLSGGTLSSIGMDASWPILAGNQAPPLPFPGLGLRFCSGWRCGLCLRPMVATCSSIKLAEKVLKRLDFAKNYWWVKFAMKVDKARSLWSRIRRWKEGRSYPYSGS